VPRLKVTFNLQNDEWPVLRLNAHGFTVPALQTTPGPTVASFVFDSGVAVTVQVESATPSTELGQTFHGTDPDSRELLELVSALAVTETERWLRDVAVTQTVA
jgi:hypothetical protein